MPANLSSDSDIDAMNQFIKNEIDQQYIDEQTLLLPSSETEEIVEKLIVVDETDCWDIVYCSLI